MVSVLGAAPTSAEILQASASDEWRSLSPENALYLELPHGRVIIELAPQFAPKHVENIKRLISLRFFDDLPILRVQENYVVQWGPSEEQKATKHDPTKLPAEFTRPWTKAGWTPLRDADAYAAEVGFFEGFPVARSPKEKQMWLTHCYGMVGAGRDNAPDSSNGTELYAVIGHAPRHLDRNITLVGRVVWGMELLSSQPRGHGAMGFYEKNETGQRFNTVRLASEVPEADRTPLQLLKTDSKSFQKYVESRRNRREPWFVRPMGGVDVCNVPLPARVQPTK